MLLCIQYTEKIIVFQGRLIRLSKQKAPKKIPVTKFPQKRQFQRPLNNIFVVSLYRLFDLTLIYYQGK